MFLKKIHIEMYRNFYNTNIELEEGLNVVIGANNTGKSNLLKVINLLHSNNPKLSIDDINKNELMANFTSYLETPPVIKIQYGIQHSLDLSKPDSAFEKLEKFLKYKDDGGLDEINDLAALDALIELRYELDPPVLEDYKSLMTDVADFNSFMDNLITFAESYQTNFYNVETNSIIETKYVNSIFEIENIGAERPTTEIENVSKAFVKTQIEDVDTKQLTSDIRTNIKTSFRSITDNINIQIKQDQDEIGITNGKNEFISSFDFDGDFTNYFQYELKNTEDGYSLPVFHNGLGYNNLIYISNKIKQKKDNDYNILLIEEPEAHLHPNMQYKLIKYIEKLKSNQDKGIQNQIIVTTHSSNISASTNFDHMILFNYEKNSDEIKNVKAIRFGDCFNFSKIHEFLNVSKSEDENADEFDKFKNDVPENLKHYRNHLEKFLDVTRSDVLFSTKVILVEGIAEKLTIPLFAELLDINLVNQHIVIEDVGGITFNNFLPIFLGQNKKAACFSDCDFKYIIANGKSNEINDFTLYEQHVQKKSNEFIKREFKNNQYFKFYTQSKKGSTFETELILENYEDDKNFKFLVDLSNLPLGTVILSDGTIDSESGISYYVKNKSIRELKSNIHKITPHQTKKKVEGLLELFYDRYDLEQDVSKKNVIERIFFTHLLYSYIKDAKGNFALALASNPNIKKRPVNIEGEKESDVYLKVPSYIEEGLKWLLI